MTIRGIAAVVAVATAFAGCAMGGTGTGGSAPVSQDRVPASQNSPFDAPISPLERAREAAVVARVDAKLQSGYVFQHAGSIGYIIVRTDGTREVHGAPGGFVTVSLVPKTNDRFLFHSIGSSSGGASVNSTPVSPCDDSCTGGMPGSPGPQATPRPPPNYASCSRAGGATWYDEDSGLGGCLGVGGSRGLSCGTWAYRSPGRGKLVMKDGTTYDDFTYASDNGFGGCRLGD